MEHHHRRRPYSFGDFHIFDLPEPVTDDSVYFLRHKLQERKHYDNRRLSTKEIT